MKIISKLTLCLCVAGLLSCAGPRDPNDMGLVERLPAGGYVIWNTGSRHIVKCVKDDGKSYWLNDAHFGENGIPGRDAHEYREKTRIIIR